MCQRESHRNTYQNKRVIVTGGLGFLGSNLVHELSSAGAQVTVIDSLEQGCGGSLANLQGLPRRCRVIQANIGDTAQLRTALCEGEVVFNLAGEISHGRSMREPERDAQLNAMAQLRFLSALADWRRGVRVVYAGTRQVYGVPLELPVNEDHPIDPVDFNGIHKYAATMYHMLFSRLGSLDAAVLRLSNIYGPRMALNVAGQGFLGVFLRRALRGESLTVFSPGDQLRDPIYVDDAVEAFLIAGAVEKLPARSFNLGGPEALSLRDLAGIVAEAAGIRGRVEIREFPRDQKNYDIGSYVADWSRASTLLGWQPRVRFEEGVRATLEFYRRGRCQALAGHPAARVPLELQ